MNVGDLYITVWDGEKFVPLTRYLLSFVLGSIEPNALREMEFVEDVKAAADGIAQKWANR